MMSNLRLFWLGGSESEQNAACQKIEQKEISKVRSVMVA
jgi:hypothetical protein